MPTLTFPLSRIEGHAQVVIEVEAGQVVSARFEAMELRGFEHFVRGVPAEQMPIIVPRICGVCSAAHHVAAVEALEDAYEVKLPPLAATIRELILLGQLIQNQATSLFIFTMPDRLEVPSILQAERNRDSKIGPQGIAPLALKVRKAGTDLITLSGGQFIHPVKAVVGGVTSGIDPEMAASMRAQLSDTLPIARDLVDYYWEETLAMAERVGTWGDDTPSYYIATTADDEPTYLADKIRIMDPGGEISASFLPGDFRIHLFCKETEYSYADHTSYKGEVIRANSLARVNMALRLGTPHADTYLQNFQQQFGQPAHAIMYFDLCRGIELVYALERAIVILEEPLDHEDTDVGYAPKDGEGYGLVEAPRGPLIHHYCIENGLISQAEFIIPTVHNVLAIEKALRVAAEHYITPERIDMELERAVGWVVRAFDPCIACATH
jgi:F420-non-reducing hydrogenase large subunit